MSIYTMVEEIAQGLKVKVGGQYQVTPYHLSGTIQGLLLPTSGSSPDLIVFNTESKRLTVVEVKGSNREYDLPFATIPVVRNMKEAYKGLQPQVVLVTAASVPKPLQDQLASENVSVIKYDNPEQAVSDLAAILLGQQDKP